MIKEQFKTELKNDFDHKMINLVYVIVNEQNGAHAVAVIPTGLKLHCITDMTHAIVLGLLRLLVNVVYENVHYF